MAGNKAKKTNKYVCNVGRRKTSTASVYVKKGNGEVMVNKKKLEDYFPANINKDGILKPLSLVGCLDKYDIYANAKGGGVSSQAEAIRLGIARYLASINDEYRPVLRKAGLLTRDDRAVESKKAGFKKARKKFKFSKR